MLELVYILVYTNCDLLKKESLTDKTRIHLNTCYH